MQKYVRLFIGCGVIVLALFGLAHILGANLEQYASILHDQPEWLTALIGITLLLSDVFLPVPSSMIMLTRALNWCRLGHDCREFGRSLFGFVAFGIGRLNKTRVDT